MNPASLRLLERRGLVHLTPSIPETFTAASPLTVLNAKAREIADQAASVLQVVQKLAEEYALKANCSVGLELPREANELWHIDGRKHIYHRVGQMLRRAAKSISYYATPGGLVRAYKAHAKYLENVSKRGVAVRLLDCQHHILHRVYGLPSRPRALLEFPSYFLLDPR